MIQLAPLFALALGPVPLPAWLYAQLEALLYSGHLGFSPLKIPTDHQGLEPLLVGLLGIGQGVWQVQIQVLTLCLPSASASAAFSPFEAAVSLLETVPCP